MDIFVFQFCCTFGCVSFCFDTIPFWFWNFNCVSIFRLRSSDFYSFIYYVLKYWSMIPPWLFVVIALAICDILWFHMNFMSVCSSSLKNGMETLTGIAMGKMFFGEMYFGENVHLNGVNSCRPRTSPVQWTLPLQKVPLVYYTAAHSTVSGSPLASSVNGFSITMTESLFAFSLSVPPASH